MDLIKIERRVPGTLVLQFQDWQNFQNKINIAIEHNQEFRFVPMNLVLGMFLLHILLRPIRMVCLRCLKATRRKYLLKQLS